MKVILAECDVCNEVDYCVESEGLIVCSNCIHKLKKEKKEVDFEEELYSNQSSIFDYL